MILRGVRFNHRVPRIAPEPYPPGWWPRFQAGLACRAGWGHVGAMHVPSSEFRAALGAFATGVCVAATRDGAGLPAGVTVNSFASVSLDPPLVLFCLGRGGTALARFSAAPSWAIHVLSDSQRDLARRFALSRRHAPGVDPWDGLAWDEDDTGLPVLPGCLARLTCLSERVVEGGDHAILLGRVSRLSWEKAGRPLLYFRGRYEAVAPPLTT